MREQGLEVREGAFRPTNKRGNHLDAKPGGVSLQGWEGDDCMVRFQGHAGHPEDDSWVGGTFPHNLTRAEEAGKGKGESCLVDLLIMCGQVSQGVDGNDDAA